MKEWRKFKVGSPSTRQNFTENDCRPFVQVGHVSHADVAMSIVESGLIRKGLVFDESRLNVERILVTWFSPNYWSPGYRYGNVRFDFNFDSLVAGKKYYWVEAIAYGIAACRILVTDQDHSAILLAYDPTTGDGPWWYDVSTDTHYFNSNHTLEFMFECDVRIDEAEEITFVPHHSDYCSVHRNSPRSCKTIGAPAGKGGALFLMKAIAAGVDLSEITAQLGMAKIKNGNRSNAGPHLESALCEVARFVCKQASFSGTVQTADAVAGALVRGIFNAITISNRYEALDLIDLFASEDELLDAVADIVARSLGTTDRHVIRRAMQ